MKTQDLPEEFKIYDIVRRDKKHFRIRGDMKIKIMRSNSQLFELPDGTIINKADIMGIDFVKEDTYSEFNALPQAKQKELMSYIKVHAELD